MQHPKKARLSWILVLERVENSGRICFFGTNSTGRRVPIVAILTRLLMRFDPDQYRVRQNASGLAAPFEHGRASTRTIHEGSKAILGKSLDKILTRVSSEIVPGQMKKDGCGKTKGIDPIHDPSMTGDDRTIVLHSPNALDRGHDQASAEPH
jgi:hypothetical protein